MSKESDKIFYELWFPRNTQHLTIIAPPSFDDLEDAKVTSPNYALLDNLGDRDSIFNIGKLLSRRYPKAIIDLKCSEGLSNRSVPLNDNLVIIGGPGGSYNDNNGNNLKGNEVCWLLSVNFLKSKISYSNDCENMILEGERVLPSKYDKRSKLMTLDYGYFSAFKNPFYSKTRVIMLHGIHTLGVLGATRVFDGGEQDSINNLVGLKSYIEEHNPKAGYNFETFFEVKVSQGWITCPKLNPQDIWFFNETVSTDNFSQNKGSNNDDNGLKDTIINIITIASNNTTDYARKKSHKELINKISLLTDDSMNILEKIYSVCMKNKNIPENYIDEINTLLSSEAK